ncbi:hypothetical protein [Chitinivorax sp. B]|uniref:hypothetical protein n=1 Tax=Chitinivorax sp. B TaxID=2502235 RepID=UPI0010F8BDAE|nr:hypothetical protein [Chitinivorax sp. B]
MNTELPKVNPNTVDFSGSAVYVNRTSRFVLSIPNLREAGELLIFPEGDSKVGQPMKKNQIGSADRGVIFFNGKDSAWQAVRANGNEAILINDISKEDADLLKSHIDSLTTDGRKLTLQSIKNILSYARNEIGLIDFYHKSLASIKRDMIAMSVKNPYYMIVTKSNKHRAIFVDKPFSFDGPVQQKYPNGAVLVTDGRNTWGIATDVFVKNFKRIEGDQEISLTSTDGMLRLQ